jgi:hypothetical protein
MDAPNRGKLCTRVDDAACDETPGQRGERCTRANDDAACDEIPAPARPGEVIARVATAQSGSITKQQLLRAGLESNAVDRRAESGALHRVHRGVYLVGHQALAPLARETAALPACGAGAVISHSSAAVVGVWRLHARRFRYSRHGHRT